MKEKLKVPNRLVKYLDEKIHFNKKFISMDAMVLDDFPRLDIEVIKQYITFGPYQISQSHGYLAEHFKLNGRYEIKVNIELIENNSKILSAAIQSRHHNAVKYKIFISYLPNSNEYSSINGWICSCLTGLRTVGCCSHVACLIYYLSYSKYLEKPLMIPGKRLNNFLVLTNHNIEKLDGKNLSDSIETKMKKSFSTLSFDEEDSLPLSKRFALPPQKIISQPNPISQQKPATYSSQLKSIKSTPENIMIFSEFSKHIPDWGGTIDTLDPEYLIYQDLPFNNTCSIDYLLLALWCSSKFNSNVIKILEDDKSSDNFKQNILKILKMIEVFEWNRARSIWILSVLQLKPINDSFSLFSSEAGMFTNQFRNQQTIIYTCIKCKIDVKRPRRDFQLRKDENSNVFLDIDYSFICHQCSSIVYGSFVSSPICIITEPFYETTSLEDEFNLLDIPMVLEVCKRKFNFICCTIGENGHFKAIFCINKSFYLINDLDHSKGLKNVPKKHQISSIFYA